MEKIRTYEVADLKRADRFLRETLYRNPQRSRIVLEALRVNHSKDLQSVKNTADKMYETHKEWLHAKFQPSIPYLQRQEKREVTEKLLTQHFKRGLEETATLFSSRCKDYDMQDAITSYTSKFIMMLRTCEQLEINPNSAYWLAQKSHSLDRTTVINLFKKNTDLPKVVIERASLHTNPQSFIHTYRSIKKWREGERSNADNATRNKNFDENWHIPVGIQNRMLQEIDSPLGDLWNRSQLPQEIELQGFQIKDVPALRQEHSNWCGYTSLAMVLQFYGYSNITPDKIFTHLNGEYDKLLEYISPSKGPSIGALAAAAQELTSLKARILTEKDYAAIREKNPSLATPENVLHAYLKGGKPCIVREPGHFKVVTGYDPKSDRYTVNDPLFIRAVEKGKFFREVWAAQETDYPHDARHLMLVIFDPTKKKS